MCAFERSYKSPGLDGITVELLTAAWIRTRPLIVQPFHACLKLRTYPVCFKPPDIVFKKKNERALSILKVLNLVALLSCIGKDLERELAKRMSHLAIIKQSVRS